MTAGARLCQACGRAPSSVHKPGDIKLCDRCAGTDHRLPWVAAACPQCGSRHVLRFDVGVELTCCSCSHVWPETLAEVPA